MFHGLRWLAYEMWSFQLFAGSYCHEKTPCLLIFLICTAFSFFYEGGETFVTLTDLQKTWNFVAKHFWQSLSNLAQTKKKDTILLQGDALDLDLKDICVFIQQNYLDVAI